MRKDRHFRLIQNKIFRGSFGGAELGFLSKFLKRSFSEKQTFYTIIGSKIKNLLTMWYFVVKSGNKFNIFEL